jgi:hypothetical protein
MSDATYFSILGLFSAIAMSANVHKYLEERKYINILCVALNLFVMMYCCHKAAML